jgi:hypothetical protein
MWKRWSQKWADQMYAAFIAEREWYISGHNKATKYSSPPASSNWSSLVSIYYWSPHIQNVQPALLCSLIWVSQRHEKLFLCSSSPSNNSFSIYTKKGIFRADILST